ncbi:hypothetical protein EYF80_025549 [Liparis tanakae]|uniref:Uncharacterized protein n=1 Tax=Liparis tanakae TaxID=230148 RepID=A0A4Z2HEJ9_9TELE|nr:hypothetical protein EYF80_025549 [Liparis tanakae]
MRSDPIGCESQLQPGGGGGGGGGGGSWSPSALGEQEAPQPLHLPLQLPDQFGVWIFVDDGVAADLLCTVSVPGTTSDLRPVSWSWRRCVNTMVKTACERDDVSFMLVAATVLRGEQRQSPPHGDYTSQNALLTGPCCRRP